MKRLSNPARIIRLIDMIIDSLKLDLKGMVVLTEAASGAFIVTPLIAARAGAQVVAVARHSAYANVSDVLAYAKEWSQHLGVSNRIMITTDPPITFASKVDIVTNLGFVRPISADFVAKLSSTAVISLMWEGWEYRGSDLDIQACRNYDIPVIGTKETHELLQIFEYLGIVVAKLLLEREIEIFKSKIVLIGSDPFGVAIEAKLLSLGASVIRLDPSVSSSLTDISDEGIDALVVAEHKDSREIVGDKGCIDPMELAELGIPLIHISGVVDICSLNRAGVLKYPTKPVEFGYMTVTADYCGPRPIIDLHASGLKVGEVMYRAKKAGLTVAEIERIAVSSGFGSLIPQNIQ